LALALALNRFERCPALVLRTFSTYWNDAKKVKNSKKTRCFAKQIIFEFQNIQHKSKGIVS